MMQFFFYCINPEGQRSVIYSGLSTYQSDGCLYKILTKLLAERMKEVIDSLVRETQYAFIRGRQITDEIVMVNETVSWAKKEKHQVLLLKVDFAKAYDSVSWKFLQPILWQMNFGSKWGRWISACLESARASVLVNSSPTAKCGMERGLR